MNNNIKINYLSGNFTNCGDYKIAIVCARFNDFIVKKLEEAAVETLNRFGVKDVTIAYVPGAHEIPVAAKRLAASGKYHAIIALGAVIRGATPHFEVVVNESAKGLSNIALEFQMPVINGILTTNNIEQAIERAGTKAGNKGADCAMAALEMISLFNELK